MPRKITPLVEPGQKYCHRCATPKALADFPRNPRKPDGRGSPCKACAKVAQAKGAVTRRQIDLLLERFAGRDTVCLVDLVGLDLNLPV